MLTTFVHSQGRGYGDPAVGSDGNLIKHGLGECISAPWRPCCLSEEGVSAHVQTHVQMRSAGTNAPHPALYPEPGTLNPLRPGLYRHDA